MAMNDSQIKNVVFYILKFYMYNTNWYTDPGINEPVGVLPLVVLFVWSDRVVYLHLVPLLQLTRRTFFEADLHDQKKEEEERALLLAEEREKDIRDKEKPPQNKKLAKPVSNLKPMPSPRVEYRKGGSQTSLGGSGGLAGSTVGGLSPAMAHRSIGECS